MHYWYFIDVASVACTAAIYPKAWSFRFSLTSPSHFHPFPSAPAGVDASEKLAQLRRQVAIAHGADALIFLSALDEIMWLLNVRGADIPFSPLARAHLLVMPDEAHLFTDRYACSRGCTCGRTTNG